MKAIQNSVSLSRLGHSDMFQVMQLTKFRALKIFASGTLYTILDKSKFVRLAGAISNRILANYCKQCAVYINVLCLERFLKN